MKPVIGIISTLSRGELWPYYRIEQGYVEAVLHANGFPLLFPVTEYSDEEIRTQFLKNIDGLLLPGGGDIAPYLFNEEPIPQVTCTSRIKDLCEIDLVQKALANQKPILGICRGIQVINVALGGTLYQDISSQYPGALCHYQDSSIRGELFHTVHVEPGSMLNQITHSTAIDTNTFHHQAVKELAPCLYATGKTSDGLIEAVESKDGKILGVQWHPENLALKHKEHASIFTYLIEQCKK